MKKHKVINSKLAAAERILVAYERMSEDEKTQLHAWEHEHVTGDGLITSEDWPGWDEAIKRVLN